MSDEVIKAAIGVDRGRELEREWLERRQSGIGGSESPVIVLGRNYTSTPLDVYISKKQPPEMRTDSDDTRRGHCYEPLAIALFEAQTGIKVFSPSTDEERYRDFFIRDPDHPWIYANLDGMCEDGWIYEGKAPRQRKADRIASEGAGDAYQVQCNQQSHVANVAPTLPGVGDRWRGKIKGTRLVFYHPETVALTIIEIPYDAEMAALIVEKVTAFWHDHVEAEVPPVVPAPPRPVKAKAAKTKNIGGKYVAVAGPEWEAMDAAYVVAGQAAGVAVRRLDRAKEQIKAAAQRDRLEAFQMPSGVKFSCKEQEGRRTLNEKLLRFEHPEIDWLRYEKVGEAFTSLRPYGGKGDGEGDGDLGGQLLTLQEELEAFGGRDFAGDTQALLDAFEDVRTRADLYRRAIGTEAEQIEALVTRAADALAERLKR